jgi:RpiB/LacA/LacB family sugar-phosphate isomerase
MTMHVAVASDHGGFLLKGKVLEYLGGLGHTVEDLGTRDTTPVDYPDFAEAVAAAILSERVERAVLICGSGVGASVAANKFSGIRAGLCHDTYSAHQGVEHDHMNVLVLGGRVIGEELAHELVRAFVDAKPSDETRHLRRLAKIGAIEAKCGLETLNGRRVATEFCIHKRELAP